MMKKVMVIAAVMVMLLSARWAQGSITEIVNGSFEYDGYIDDITVEAPNNWDVNVPADKFDGWVYNDWVTHGSYNLSLCSYWYVQFEANDIATVSQQLNLADVNAIVFDLKLETYPSTQPWDPNKRTALLLIDNEPVWNSDDCEPDANDEYRNQFADIDINDSDLHRLFLGIRADVNEELLDVDTMYFAHWDYIRLNRYCGDNGISGDFNHDCRVDENDLKMLAEVWLDEVEADDKYNLFGGDDIEPYGIINFLDFAIFADNWMYDRYE